VVNKRCIKPTDNQEWTIQRHLLLSWSHLSHCSWNKEFTRYR